MARQSVRRPRRNVAETWYEVICAERLVIDVRLYLYVDFIQVLFNRAFIDLLLVQFLFFPNFMFCLLSFNLFLSHFGVYCPIN